ncbi:hypothetical protein H5410_052489 [Solanum commersonii]|uniref:Uncharacterized protein n=1 Tax=Solanum commersonii TaxID=4109 RepID=A0A9J5X3S0_SOLCO|nr:hypothetical protein H5410_052489 [Solanum commersonii]
MVSEDVTRDKVDQNHSKGSCLEGSTVSWPCKVNKQWSTMEEKYLIKDIFFVFLTTRETRNRYPLAAHRMYSEVGVNGSKCRRQKITRARVLVPEYGAGRGAIFDCKLRKIGI